MKKIKKKKKVGRILFMIISIFVLTAFGINIVNNITSDINVTLVDDLTFVVNSDVMVSSLISNVEGGLLVEEDKLVDTSEIGKKKIVVNIEKDNKEIEEYSFDINIIDNEKPVIEVEERIIIGTGDEVDLISYVKVSDNYDKNLDIKVDGTYDNNVNGEYKLMYVVKDSSGNESIKEFTLVVEKPKYKRMTDKTITTSNGHTLIIKNGIASVDGILIANKTYYLPENYVPIDSYATLSSNCVNCLEKEVMNAYNEMKNDAKSIGLSLWLASGYRSYTTQSYLYNNYVARDGKNAADTYSARAGHSEHQTGLAFDLNSVNSSFANTSEGKWIKDNCHLYGFVIRYPKGKENITGYMYEPWHLRFVGKELAKKLYNDGDWITIEEHFGITSEYVG